MLLSEKVVIVVLLAICCAMTHSSLPHQSVWSLKAASHCLQPVRGQDAEDLAAECPHLFQVKGAGNTRELLALDPLHPDREIRCLRENELERVRLPCVGHLMAVTWLERLSTTSVSEHHDDINAHLLVTGAS